MIKYYVTFLGNDEYQAGYCVNAENFTEAVSKANDLLPLVESHTIEKVRIGSIEEFEHFALDRTMGQSKIT